MRWPRPKSRVVNPSEALVEAIGSGNLERVYTLLAEGADPNAIEEAGDVTPLMSAAIGGSLEIVAALVEGGADPNAIAEDLSGDLDKFTFLDGLNQFGRLRGETALVYAALYGHEAVYDYLASRTALELRKEAEAVRQAQIESGAAALSRASRKPREPSSNRKEAELFLQQNPRLRRWMNECVLCNTTGYKPEMPEDIDKKGSAAAIRRLFRPLAMSDVQIICARCKAKGDKVMAERERRRTR